MQIKRFPLGALWTNCYLVWGDDATAVVVDPGGEASEVLRFIDDSGLSLKWVLLTHGHGDHLGGVGQVRRRSENGVAIHAEDADCLTSAAANLSGAMGAEYSTAPADRLLHDGDVIEAGSLRISVIHTPGHTRGGVAYYIEEGAERLLISGDTLFARSVGRTDLPGGDEATLNASLKKLAALPPDTPVYPGHGPDTTIGGERDNNPFWPR